jgi:uncharacterized protein (TIGR02466 family)
MEVKSLFADFFVQDTLDIDHDAIAELVYRKQKESEDESIYFDGTEPEMALFYEQVHAKLHALHRAIGLTPTLQQSLYQAWANVNSSEFITSPHSHTERPYACISGVYYPKAEGKVYPIEFMNNNSAVEATIPLDLIEEETRFNSSVRRVYPETGMLLLFPSWLKHYVAMTKDKTESDRISLAFNAEMVPMQ